MSPYTRDTGVAVEELRNEAVKVPLSTLPDAAQTDPRLASKLKKRKGKKAFIGRIPKCFEAGSNLVTELRAISKERTEREERIAQSQLDFKAFLEAHRLPGSTPCLGLQPDAVETGILQRLDCCSDEDLGASLLSDCGFPCHPLGLR